MKRITFSEIAQRWRVSRQATHYSIRRAAAQGVCTIKFDPIIGRNWLTLAELARVERWRAKNVLGRKTP